MVSSVELDCLEGIRVVDFTAVRGGAVLHRSRWPGSAPRWSRSRTRGPAIPAAGCSPASPTTTRGISTSSTPTRSR